MMQNVVVEVLDNNTIVVKADTERFGKNAIMFQGWTFMMCFDYIRRATRKNHFKIDGMPFVHGVYTDSEGRTMCRKLFIRFPKEVSA